MSCEGVAASPTSEELSATVCPSAVDRRLSGAVRELAVPERCTHQIKGLLADMHMGRFSAEDISQSSHCGMFLKAICRCSFTQQVVAEEFYEYREEDFPGTREIIALAIPILLDVLRTNALPRAANAVEEMVNEFILLFSMNNVKQAWNTDSTVADISDGLNIVMNVLKCSSTADLVRFTSKSCGIAPAASIATYLREHLSRRQWKRWPGAQASFVWLVGQLGFPAMSDYIDTLVPASLLFVDDYVLEHKIAGVQCLQRIMDHCGRTELTWHDRASVIYQALLHLTYTRESSLVSVLYPCLLRILDVLERCPPFDEESSIGRHDVIFERLLDEMYTEDKIALRQAYAANLLPFVGRMGVYSIRHLKKLLMVVTSYLELGDSPEETTRVAILVSLQHLLRFAWPRLSAPHHVTSLMTSIAKIVADASAGDERTVAAAAGSRALVQEAVCCLVLLARCSDVARAALGDLHRAASAERGLEAAAKCFDQALGQAALP